MPVVCDYTLLNKETADKTQDGTFEKPYVIDHNLGESFTHAFSTDGMQFGAALLSMMVSGLTRASSRVRIKSRLGTHLIGRLMPVARVGDNSDELDLEKAVWRHEQFIIKTNILATGADANTLILGRAELGNDQHETFKVRDIVCFFKQSA